MNIDAFKEHRFAPQFAAYTERDVMLYALSLGVCANPLDSNEIFFVYEKNLRVIPSMGAVLANSDSWFTDKKFDVSYVNLLHAEQRAVFHKPLPPSGELRAEYAIRAVRDKGEGRGAFVYFDKSLFDNVSGEHLCTLSITAFLAADGGAGGFGQVPESLPAVPGRAADFVEEVVIGKRAALLYRLNGDRNPLHVDRDVARRAGFETPILHGLCTYGMCGFAMLRRAFNYDTARMRSLNLRFSSPVLPGETLVIEGWETTTGVAFQAKEKVSARQVVANGFASAI